jgi:hypothetical protein
MIKRFIVVYHELAPLHSQMMTYYLYHFAKLKHHSAYLEPKESGIKIPFGNAISKCIPVSENQPWAMTVTDRTFKYLSIITKVNMDNRPRIVDTETGQFWPIATFEDLKETLLLMERAASGVRPYIANWFNDVFIPAFLRTFFLFIVLF